MEGNARNRCYTLTHEALMILDSAEGVAGVIEDADKLLRWPAAQKQAAWKYDDLLKGTSIMSILWFDSPFSEITVLTGWWEGDYDL